MKAINVEKSTEQKNIITCVFHLVSQQCVNLKLAFGIHGISVRICYGNASETGFIKM